LLILHIIFLLLNKYPEGLVEPCYYQGIVYSLLELKQNKFSHVFPCKMSTIRKTIDSLCTHRCPTKHTDVWQHDMA